MNSLPSQNIQLHCRHYQTLSQISKTWTNPIYCQQQFRHFTIFKEILQEITNVPVAFVWKRAPYWYDNTSTFFQCSKSPYYPYNWQVEGLLIPSMPKTNIKYYSTYISYLCVQHMAQKFGLNPIKTIQILITNYHYANSEKVIRINFDIFKKHNVFF